MARKTARKLIEMVHAGAISWETIARECLRRMPEDEARDMAEGNGWTKAGEEGGE